MSEYIAGAALGATKTITKEIAKDLSTFGSELREFGAGGVNNVTAFLTQLNGMSDVSMTSPALDILKALFLETTAEGQVAIMEKLVELVTDPNTQIILKSVFGLVNDFLLWVSDFLGKVPGAMANLVTQYNNMVTAIDTLVDKFEDMEARMTAAINRIVGAFDTGMEKIEKVTNGTWDRIKNVWTKIKAIFGG